jgi:hypothetical protein
LAYKINFRKPKKLKNLSRKESNTSKITWKTWVNERIEEVQQAGLLLQRPSQ